MRFFQKLVLCLLVFQVRAHAQNTAEFDMDAENISGGYAECAAYYRLIYFAMKQSNDEETANNYRQVEDRAMLYSLLMSQAGRSQDKAVEVTNSRIEMYIKK